MILLALQDELVSLHLVCSIDGGRIAGKRHACDLECVISQV